MPSLTTLLAALEITLLHSLWQGAVIAFGVWSLGARSRAPTRYTLAMVGLLLMPLAAVATFWLTLVSPGAGPGQGVRSGLLPSLAPWIDSGWLLGNLALLTRSALGLRSLSRLDAQAIQPPAWLDELFRVMAGKMGINGVRLKLLTEGTGPFTVGALRAVVYMPVSVVTALTPDQIEAVLAHEFEHIRRHDFAWNLIQVVVEAAFFYHPAVWWLGARLRDERELCCDDAAVTACRQAVTYASALLALEECRRTLSLAVALNGQGPSLLSRVRRLLTPDAPETPKPSAVFKGLITACVLAGALAFIAGAPHSPHPVVSRLPNLRLTPTAMVPDPPPAIKPVAHGHRAVERVRHPDSVERVVSEAQQARDREDARRNSLIVQHPVTPEQAAADTEATRREAARGQASA